MGIMTWSLCQETKFKEMVSLWSLVIVCYPYLLNSNKNDIFIPWKKNLNKGSKRVKKKIELPIFFYKNQIYFTFLRASNKDFELRYLFFYIN